MADITDISKLRPDLLEKSDKELERMLTEIQMAQEHRRYEARKAEVASQVQKINAAIEAFNSSVSTLNEAGFLNPSIKDALTTEKGVFSPHLKHKQVDADRVLVPMMADGDDKPKRTRRKRSV